MKTCPLCGVGIGDNDKPRITGVCVSCSGRLRRDARRGGIDLERDEGAAFVAGVYLWRCRGAWRFDRVDWSARERLSA